MTHPRDPRDLKDLYERQARAVSRRPELARSVGVVRARACADLVCSADEAGVSRAVELPVAGGAGARHPSPAELLRASLAASLALGYRLWAARLELPVDAVEVELRTDDDVRGQLCAGSEVGPGWQRIHVVVTIASAAPWDAIAALVATADRHCLVLATLAREIERVHQLHVIAPGAKERDVPPDVTP